MEHSVIRGRLIPDYAEFIIGPAGGRTRWLNPGYKGKVGARTAKYIAAARRRLPAPHPTLPRARGRVGWGAERFECPRATHLRRRIKPDGCSEGASTSPCRIAFASRMISRQDNNST